MELGVCVGQNIGPVLGIIDETLLVYSFDISIQSEEGFLSVLTDVMAPDLIGEMLIKILSISDGVSLVLSKIIEWVSFDVSVDGAKYLPRLGTEIRIWFVSNLGNDDSLSLGRYGGTSYGKKPGV